MEEIKIYVLVGILLALVFIAAKWEKIEMARHGLQQCVIVTEHGSDTAWQRECGK